jgi:hypothetical protein
MTSPLANKLQRGHLKGEPETFPRKEGTGHKISGMSALNPCGTPVTTEEDLGVLKKILSLPKTKINLNLMKRTYLI